MRALRRRAAGRALVGALTLVLTLTLALAPTDLAPASAADVPVCSGRDLSNVAGLAQAKARRADELVNGEGLLWRIEKPGLPVSWLFGTMHSTDEGAVAVARRAAASIGSVKVMATELGPLDAATKANLSAGLLKLAIDRDHDTFDAAPDLDRAAVETLIASLGYPVSFAHHLKLWFVAILASTPTCETKREAAGLQVVDEFLMQEAKIAGVRVVGLETGQEQMDAVASITPDVSAALLTAAARNGALNDDVYATTLKLYVEGRPADVVAVGDLVGDMSQKERDASDAFTRLLLVQRNATMVARAEPLLHEGVFIAVGALHLPGKDGLIERLRRAGYTVTKVW